MSILKMPFYSLLMAACVVFMPLHAQAVVVLSEIMFNPVGDEASDEFVELYNDAAFPAQLAGWTISDGEGVDTLVSTGQGLIASPRQYILILDSDYIDSGSITYDGLVPESALIVTISNGTFGSRGLSNSSGETVSIRNANGSLVSEYRYSVENEPGHSDEKVRLSGSNDTTNWRNSETVHGTPGSRNTVTPPERDLGIGEFHIVPEYPPAGNMFQLELVIMNFGLLSMGADLLLTADSSGSGAFYSLSLLTVPAFAAGDSTSVVDSIEMPYTGLMQIVARLDVSDDDSTNNVMDVLASSEVSETGLRINEIQYAPVAGWAEWIELAVGGPIPVSTRGIQVADGQGISDTSARYALPEWVLLPGEYVIVTTDSAIFLDDIPFETRVAVFLSSGMTLNNNGDSLVIFSPDKSVLDRVDYRPNWGNGENGKSLERVSFSSPSNDPANWGASTDPQGSTPGRMNSRSIINPNSAASLTASPSPFTPNGDGIDDVTEIRFSTQNRDAIIALKIFDTRGRLVRTLHANQLSNIGSVLWDGRKENGQMANTARYIVMLESRTESRAFLRERTTVILARPK